MVRQGQRRQRVNATIRSSGSGEVWFNAEGVRKFQPRATPWVPHVNLGPRTLKGFARTLSAFANMNRGLKTQGVALGWD